MSRSNLARSDDHGHPPRVVIVGGGFAGVNAARSLRRALPEPSAEVILINPNDYSLYLPLLPDVAAGVLDPRRLTAPLSGAAPGVRFALGDATTIVPAQRRLSYIDPEGAEHSIGYDRLVLATGSINKPLPIPGVAEFAHGFRGIPEALYLRDHLIRQLELAAATSDPGERSARCTFVVAGAGYTGTELAAHGPLFTAVISRRIRELRQQPVRWHLLDVAPRVLPELDERLAQTADDVLRRRGVDIHLGTSVEEATRDGVRLTTGQTIGTRTLIWCTGARPDPLAESAGLPTDKGRIVVDATLAVAEHPEIYACGDVAAVPDLTRPGEVAAMTAQHATRQGTVAGRNVAATLGYGTMSSYQHRDLGFVVDLGGAKAAANPLHIPLKGVLAMAVTRGYHLFSMRANRLRTATDWLLDPLVGRQAAQLGLVRSGAVPLRTDSPEHLMRSEHATGHLGGHSPEPRP